MGHKTVTLYCMGCGERHVVTVRCGDRCCPKCRGSDYVRLVKGYLGSVKAITRPKLLTLTVRNVEQLNREYIRWVRRCFVRMMRWKYYRELVRGGLCAFEVTNRGRGWHVHLHIVLDALFIPQKKLSNDWSKITGGSGVVDIRAAGTVGEALRYCLKYLSKGPGLKDKNEVISEVELEGRREVYREAVHGVRLVQAFGSLYDQLVIVAEKLACRRCGSHAFICWEFELRGELNRFRDNGG